MRIFVEGEKYPLDLLRETFGEKFYTSDGSNGVIDHVGYFHSGYNEIVYLLPKVFIDERGLIFNKYRKDDFAQKDVEKQLESETELNWLKRFLIIFYKGLIEYRNRFRDNGIVEKEQILQLNSSIGEHEYSFLDLVLSFANFHNKNKQNLLFTYKKQTSQKHKNVSWERTVRKIKPLVSSNYKPIYLDFNTKNKILNNEEELLCIFYSVLNHLKFEYDLPINISDSYRIYQGKAFETLCEKASKILRKIRYKYFSDTLVKIYKLLEIYFSKYKTASYSNKKEEFITVKHYHLVFEDMIDKIFSDDVYDTETKRNVSLKKLKDQKDGKIVDHLFEYESIIDRDESIFYIGDSKYYKSGNRVGEHSIYKQFTYAKNVIQFNIDLLNEGKEINEKIRYRDEITEGYNITPNFFIQGRLYEDFDFEQHRVKLDKARGTNGLEHSFHFEKRLFDRDSLFVHYYTINFLYVLNTYTKRNTSEIEKFRESKIEEFRNNLVEYFNAESAFFFFEREFEDSTELEDYVNQNFRNLCGKIYRTKSESNKLILAKHEFDDLETVDYVEKDLR